LLPPIVRSNQPEEFTMPFINVKLIDGVFSPAQKKQIAERLTDAMVSIEGEAMRAVTWVVVEEVKSGDWAIGGKTLSTADVHALAGRKAA
jgi:4-oxalocrotonate tautomerase